MIVPVVVDAVVICVARGCIKLDGIHSFTCRIVSCFVVKLAVVTSILVLAGKGCRGPSDPEFLCFGFSGL